MQYTAAMRAKVPMDAAMKRPTLVFSLSKEASDEAQTHAAVTAQGDCVNGTFGVPACSICLDHTYTFASRPNERTPLLWAAPVREVEREEDGDHSAQTAGSLGGKSATGRELPEPPCLS